MTTGDPGAANRADLEAAERRIANEIDPGVRALFVAVAVLVLLASFSLPHAGSANGWEVLAYAPDARAEAIALPSRVFVWLALVFGGVGSILALVTRRWFIAWGAVAGSAVSIIFGMLSVWSRQTVAVVDGEAVGAGAGIGLFLGWLAVAVLTFHWVRVVWARTSTQLEAEARLREIAAEEDRRGLYGTGTP
ncbi:MULTISPECIES: Rv2732c family membrane protein [Rhodococcus]|uniref:Rv2732c family membrane protein n=1 Tax=Rhodococcus TaxID=1827 RepID=UPI001CF89C85|nr:MULTISPECIES: hypothetical protein [Rhodococcus]